MGERGSVVLDAVGVGVELGGREVLDDVSIRVCAGESVALIGPNGAGKTTLLRAVLGLTPIRRGSISLAGKPPMAARHRVGYVPQRHEFAWDYPVSVRQVVMTGRVRHIGWLGRTGPDDRMAVDGALERTGMTALADRVVGELSGGQRQRTLVARALAMDPPLLLLDEPFTGLDVPTQQSLTSLFDDLREDGRALLMTTHDIAAAATSATRICLLNRKVIADGAPAQVQDRELWLRAFGVQMPAVPGAQQPVATPAPQGERSTDG